MGGESGAATDPGQQRTDVLENRREKLEELRRRGVDPYAYRFDTSHAAAEARAEFERLESDGALNDAGDGSRVRLAGRLVALRSHGRSSFADLADRSGRIQLHLRRNVLGADAYDLLDLLDLGDWIGIEGPLFRTRMGEVTVRVEHYEVLSKSLRPLPFGKEEVDEETGARVVHSGFSDIEQRYRQRYADLAVNPEVREIFIKRARIVRAMREFLDERGFLEVETPALQPLYGGATARPFTTHHHALDMPLYLRIADELYLKRLIVGGLDRVYEIGKDFRNEGIDRTHNPEFTMLEFYQALADYQAMMDTVEALIRHVVRAVTDGSLEVRYQGETIDFQPAFERVAFFDALEQALGSDARAMDESELRTALERRGTDAAGLEAMGQGALLDELFSQTVEPSLVRPTFVLDYPKALSPLAKPKRGAEALVERFELYVAGREIANAFSELNDPLDQRERFEEQARLREGGDVEAQQMDEDYLRAMEYGMPPTGGVGIGVDRLCMLLTDQPSIRDVLLFPTMRPE